MSLVSTPHFKPIKFDFGKIHMSGGQSTKAYPMTSKQVVGMDGESLTFVKLAVSERWLVASTTGVSKYSSSSFGRTSLLDDLREQIQIHCDDPGSNSAPDPAADADHDPMAEVGQEGDPPSAPKIKGRGQKRLRYYKNHRTKTTVSFDMPVRCPEEDPTCTDMRKVRVYIEDRKQIWLDIADVEWAVRYLYIQNHLKGVPLIPDDSVGPAGVP